MNSAVIFGGCGFIGLYFAEKALDLSLFEDWKKINPKDW